VHRAVHLYMFKM